MTGIVSTNIFTNHPDPKLPEESYWTPASKEITAIVKGGSEVHESGMTPAEFAKRVVDDVLVGRTGVTWRGKMASIAWGLSGFLPKWVLVSLNLLGMRMVGSRLMI